MQVHGKIDLHEAMLQIKLDRPTAQLLTVTPFDRVFSGTPDDAAEIEVEYFDRVRGCTGRALYGVTSKGDVTLYAD